MRAPRRLAPEVWRRFAAIFAHNIPVPQIQAAATAVAVVGGVVGVFAPEVGSKIQQIGSAASEGIAKKP